MTEQKKTAQMKAKKLRVRYYNEAFQAYYGFWLAGLGLLCFILTGFLVYQSLDRYLKSLGDHFQINLFEAFLQMEVLIPLGCILMFLFVIGVVGTHKLAGPIFALRRHMTRIRLSGVPAQIRLRRDDYLHDVADALNGMTGRWDRQNREILNLLQKLEEKSPHETKEILTEIREKLPVIQHH